MILIDSSVWIDHIRRAEPAFAKLLDEVKVLAHPFIIGELALGSLRDRAAILGGLRNLPSAVVASDIEVHGLIERHALSGSGIGYADAHILASTLLTVGTRLWTRDRRLRVVAERLGVAERDH